MGIDLVTLSRGDGSYQHVESNFKIANSMVAENTNSERSFSPISPPGVFFSVGWLSSSSAKPLPIGLSETMAMPSKLG